MNIAPRKKPTAAGNTFTNPSPWLISIAGANKLQKLAATMTPPVNPNIPSSNTLLMVFTKNTIDAPKAVIAQVNKVATKAPVTGSMDSNHLIKSCNVFYLKIQCKVNFY